MTEITPETNETEIVIGIPGKWSDRRELTSALMVASVESKGYSILGNFIMNVHTGKSFGVEIYERDGNLAQSFEYAGTEKMDEMTLKEIDEHTAVVYIVAKTSGVEVIQDLVSAVSDVLRVGGLAVKIESTGIAHKKETWLQLEENKFDLVQLHSHFVTLVNYETFYSSFGMKNFGYPDILVPPTFSAEETNEVIGSLSFYMMSEQPVLQSGETYSNGIEAKFYRMDIKEDDRYDTKHVYYNPSGVVHLEAMPKKEEKKKRKLWKKFLSSKKSAD